MLAALCRFVSTLGVSPIRISGAVAERVETGSSIDGFETGVAYAAEAAPLANIKTAKPDATEVLQALKR
ncbi:hypothetical protein [Arthrobacter sp. RAF14]|uniref:hypothetical protein n=1 Tax=Arthrobacter sp. RAF14 TaxID=3233051 RepID=UPI003F8DF8F8